MTMPHKSEGEPITNQNPPVPRPAESSELWARQCPLFWNMSEEEVDEVRRRLTPEVYPKNEVILREGKSLQVLWIIAQGECEVFKTIKSNTEQRLTVLDPGSVFGEMSFFQPAPHSASVRSLTEVELKRLPREEFEQLEIASPAVAQKMLANSVRLLAERLRRMDNWTCELFERPDGPQSHRKEWRDFRAKLYTDWHF